MFSFEYLTEKLTDAHIIPFFFHRIDWNRIRDKLKNSRIFAEDNNLIRFNENVYSSSFYDFLHFINKLHTNNLLSQIITTFDNDIMKFQTLKIFKEWWLFVFFLLSCPRSTPSWLFIGWIPTSFLFNNFNIILRLFNWFITTRWPSEFLSMWIYLKNIIRRLKMTGRFSHTWRESRNIHRLKSLKIGIVHYLKIFKPMKTAMKILRISG